MHEDGRLRVARGRQLRLGTLPCNVRQRATEHIVGLLEGAARLLERVRQVSPHPHVLGALAREEEPYHRSTADAQVNPAPNATIRMLSPGLMRPCSSASSSATGIVAELMLPYRSTFTHTFSMGTFA